MDMLPRKHAAGISESLLRTKQMHSLQPALQSVAVLGGKIWEQSYVEKSCKV